MIDAIGVDAHVDRTGIDHGLMEVPDLGDAAWFTPSVKPGRIGPSVITAHVDSVDGPDVFFHLDELVAGDEIEVHGEDGDVVVFEVTAVEQHPRTPTRARPSTAPPKLQSCG